VNLGILFPSRAAVPRLALIVALTAVTATAACKKIGSSNGDVSRNWTPTRQDTYMGVPATAVQTAIGQQLATQPSAPITADQWGHVKKLYAAYNQQLLWLDDKGVHQPRVTALLTTIADADSDAIDLDRFPLAHLDSSLKALGDKPNAQQLADADVALSTAFAVYGETMLSGQVDPKNLGQSWHIDAQHEKLDSALSLSLREDDLAGALARMRPQDPGYDSLRVALAAYRAILSNGGWPTVPQGKQLRRGDRDTPERITALRARLRAEGYLANDSATAPVYDRALAGAVADYQARHAIGVDSMLGTETVQSLDLPADYRVAQIAANLERYRWLPRAFGQRYILVNVPQFYLHAYDSGQKTLDMKVIVGQEYQDKATPVFADSMEYVVFRPYWNVTPDIAAKEIFPKIAADPNYLAANDMEIYSDHGRQAVRQRPGDKNSLGLVKFLFPNDYNIYLHDTPEHQLFGKDVRAFSHGCIRVEKPTELAEWVLGWDQQRVDAAMHGADNHQVTLPRKIPVYIVYFTAYAQDGHVNFGNDLYDRDSKLVDQMKAATLTPQTQQSQQALRAMAAG
jgi:L,D-transpeptidase YcbB